MADLLLDTDVLTDHLRGARRLRVEQGDRAFVSAITRAELHAGPAEQEAAIALPGALIAATALSANLALVTRNQRDFETVQGLSIRDP